jgi:hypothetical protein
MEKVGVSVSYVDLTEEGALTKAVTAKTKVRATLLPPLRLPSPLVFVPCESPHSSPSPHPLVMRAC